MLKSVLESEEFLIELQSADEIVRTADFGSVFGLTLTGADGWETTSDGGMSLDMESGLPAACDSTDDPDDVETPDLTAVLVAGTSDEGLTAYWIGLTGT